MNHGRVLSIGQGARSFDQLVGTLQVQSVGFLIDVRSVPRSGFRPEFSREPLQRALQSEGIRYVFMGDLLGGRPEDPDCYTEGKVDYDRVRGTDAFQRGLGRLRSAVDQGLVVCLFCSEGDPARCHRSKLIGLACADEGIAVRHVLADGSVASQDDVIRTLTGGQEDLFGGAGFRSRKAYVKTGS